MDHPDPSLTRATMSTPSNRHTWGPTWRAALHAPSTLLGQKPRFRLPGRTLGWEIAAWVANYLLDEDGRPFRFTLEQLRFIVLVRAAEREIGRRVHPKTGRTMNYLACHLLDKTDVFAGDEDELADVRWVSLPEAQELLPSLFEPILAHELT